jgi:hypothetical protein
MVSLSNLKVRPLLDDRFMAILKLDVDIYNIGIKVSKCILVNLLEFYLVATTPLGSNPPHGRSFILVSISPSHFSIPKFKIN